MAVCPVFPAIFSSNLAPQNYQLTKIAPYSLVTGVNSSTMCITRNLALMFDTDKQIVAPTRAMRRRKIWTDVGICFGIPIMQAALHYIIQLNRYYVLVIGGCAPSFDNSWPTIVIMYIWPVIFGLVNCYYAGKSLIVFSTVVFSHDRNFG